MIRKIRYNDLKAVNSISAEAFATEYADKGVNITERMLYLKIGYIAERILAALFSFDRLFFMFYVFEKQGTIVGWVRLVIQSKKTVFFNSIAVHNDHRREGIGYKLFLYAEAICKKRGIKYVAATVREENIPSLNLTKKFGFIPHGRFYTYILNQPLDYGDIPLDGFRPLTREDYLKIQKAQKRTRNELFLKIYGTKQKPSVLRVFVGLLRRIFLGEKFYQYVLEKNCEILGYAFVIQFVDGSRSMTLEWFGKDSELCKKFVEAVLYYTAKEKMSVMLFDDQITEENTVKELGFEKYTTLEAFYKSL
jgi:L-amino acid N-acyltransferase YncA